MQSTLHKRIMRRVYAIYFLRLLTHRCVLKTAMIAVLVVFSGRYVSYGAVFENLPSNYMKLPMFIGGAISNTEFVTIGLVFSVLVLFLFLVRDVRSVMRQGVLA
jgi:hypothetical protein